jgi:hypothetical protein
MAPLPIGTRGGGVASTSGRSLGLGPPRQQQLLQLAQRRRRRRRAPLAPPPNAAAVTTAITTTSAAATAAAAAAHHAARHAAAVASAQHLSGGAAYLVTFCALSIALGASTLTLARTLAEVDMLDRRGRERRAVPGLTPRAAALAARGLAADGETPLSAAQALRATGGFLFGVDVRGSLDAFSDPLVLAAADFAARAHAHQVRRTGEPYVSHCVETAVIVERNLPASWRGSFGGGGGGEAEEADGVSASSSSSSSPSPSPRRGPRAEDAERARCAVVAALLHDVLDDTHTTPQELEARFGSRVADMVAKVSRLSQVHQLLRRERRRREGQGRRRVAEGEAVLGSSEQQASSFASASAAVATATAGSEEEEEDDDEFEDDVEGTGQRRPRASAGAWARLRRVMLDAVAAEPLVVLVKLADRLHNVRTLHALPEDRQRAVAEETLEVWGSLAAYLGWHGLKAEMEDLCFAALEPESYCRLRGELDALWANGGGGGGGGAGGNGSGGSGSSALPSAAAMMPAMMASSSTSSTITSSPATAARRQRVAAASAAQDEWRRQRREERAARPEGPAAGIWRGMLSLARGGRPAATANLPSQAPATPRSWLDVYGGDADELEERAEAEAAAEAEAREAEAAASGNSGPLPSSLLKGVTDAATSLQYILSTSPVSSTKASSTTNSTTTNTSNPTTTDLILHPNASSPRSASAAVALSPPAPLSAQQRRLRRVLATVVPFDAVSIAGASSARRPPSRGSSSLYGSSSAASSAASAPAFAAGLAVLDEAAERLYTELQLGSFGSGLGVEVQGRLKSLLSVQRKMRRKGCALAEVYDARALRVVVDDERGARSADAVRVCYSLLSAVHRVWKPVAGGREFDDYIANPKKSGYQALHTAVWGPGGAPIEVQIKTATMHDEAEFGGATHYKYKEAMAAAGAGGGGEVAGGGGGEAAARRRRRQERRPSQAVVEQRRRQHEEAGEEDDEEEGAFAGAPRLAVEGDAWASADDDEEEVEDGDETDDDAPAALSRQGAASLTPEDLGIDERHGYPGQPVLRVSDRSLRYGVVLSADDGSGMAAAGDDQEEDEQDGNDAARSPRRRRRSSRRAASLTVAILNGGTRSDAPLRAPSYALYDALTKYVEARGWGRAGQGDGRARLEEYALCRDGRYRRRDHLGYVHPTTTATLLEGYEQTVAGAVAMERALERAAAAAMAAESSAAAGRALLAAPPSGARGDALPAGRRGSGGGRRGVAVAEAPVASATAAAATEGRYMYAGRPSREAVAAAAAELAAALGERPAAAAAAGATGDASSWSAAAVAALPPPAPPPSPRSPSPLFFGGGGGIGSSSSSISADSTTTTATAGDDDDAEGGYDDDDLQRRWREAAAKLPSSSAAASSPSPPDTPSPPAPIDAVSVVVWPGGLITEVPRGTTAGDVLKARGVITIDSAGGGGGAGAGGGGGASAGGGGGLVNVNNRLVPEDTVLQDGDLVVLARERLNI